MKINGAELFRQRVEEIKKGKYHSIEVVLASNENNSNEAMPIVSAHFDKDGTAEEILTMYAVLKITAEEILKNFNVPKYIAEAFEKHIKAETIKIPKKD